jgi:hemoglobin-like flavoprotein
MAAVLFYGRLFDTDPALKPLFRRPMDIQGRRLMAMIGTAVDNLGNLQAFVSTVQDLGRRHMTYGVKDAHYDAVADALLWTLEQALDLDYTAEVEEAWLAAYATLANVMKDAANEPGIGEAVA